MSRPPPVDVESQHGTGSGSTESETKKQQSVSDPSRPDDSQALPNRRSITLNFETELRTFIQKAAAKEPFTDPIFGNKQTYGAARFGLIRSALIKFFGLVNVSSVRKTHWNINCWSDAEVIAWKKAHVSNCQAITVASAIFATLGLTGFLLPDVNKTHWTARAFMSSSMICGVLSVAMASSQQQRVSLLNSALQVRLWLSRGHTNINKTLYQYPFDALPLESSVFTLMKVQLPKTLLVFAVWLYLLGFGLYLGFTWGWHRYQNQGDRNIFSIFVLTVCLIVLVLGITEFYQHQDHLKRSADFALARTNITGKPEQDFGKPELLIQLEDWLGVLQRMQRMQSPQGENDPQGKVEVDDPHKVLENDMRKMLMRWNSQVRNTSLNLKKTATNTSDVQGAISLRKHAELSWATLGYMNEHEPRSSAIVESSMVPISTFKAAGALPESQDTDPEPAKSPATATVTALTMEPTTLSETVPTPTIVPSTTPAPAPAQTTATAPAQTTVPATATAPGPTSADTQP